MLPPRVKRCHTQSYSIFCEAFLDRSPRQRSSQVVGKKILLDNRLLADLYHPRATCQLADLRQEMEGDFRPEILTSNAPRWRTAPSAGGGRPCSIHDAWPYRGLFNGIFGWLFVWLPYGLELAQIRQLPVYMVRRRRLGWDDWAQKNDCTAAISIGIGKKAAPSLAKLGRNDQD